MSAQVTQNNENGKSETLDQRRAFTPRVDIFENAEELVMLADMPGVSNRELNVRIEKDQLHMEGGVPADEHGLHDGFVYRRVFALPKSIDAEKVRAELKQGQLTINLPKSAGQRPRTIQVKAS